jgi:hypothetical protein
MTTDNIQNVPTKQHFCWDIKDNLFCTGHDYMACTTVSRVGTPINTMVSRQVSRNYEMIFVPHCCSQ